jgi:acetyl esterase/lipase
LKRAGLRFAVCYEDQGLKDLKEGLDVRQALEDLAWLRDHWFGDASYLRQEGRPVLLVFGPQHLDWKKLKAEWRQPPLLFGLPHLAGNAGFDGAFAWPPVHGGKAVSSGQWRAELDSTYRGEGRVIATAFPGFRDYYKQAGVHDSYGSISSLKGATFSESLTQALASRAAVVQLATWNDYGEGTVLEPTTGSGYRYLEHLQATRRAGNPADLRLPVMLYQLRKRGGNAAELATAADQLFASKYRDAEALLAKVAAGLGRQPASFSDASGAPDDNYRLVTEVLYREGTQLTNAMHQRCRLDVYFPANKRPFQTVVWFHGGGLTAGERTIPVPLRNQGLAVVAVNYRLGPEVQSPAYLEDAAAAVAWTFQHIEEFGGDPAQVFVSGHSAGAYLATMVGLDRQWLAAFGRDADKIAGLIPLSGQMITHFAIREERGLAETQPLVDSMAPLFHVRKGCPPLLLVTGDREKELMGRYEENAYFWRAMKLAGHSDVTLHELQGFDHGRMPEPAFPLLLKFVKGKSGPERR